MLAIAVLLLYGPIAFAEHDSSLPVPYEPLPPSTIHGHTNAIVLQNRVVEAVVFPNLGRIGIFRFRGEQNVFRFDTNLAERAAAAVQPPADGEWRNFGGDWIWPVAQSHWPALFGAPWPPPRMFEEAAWRAHSWVNQDGSQHVLMETEFGPPLEIRLSRTISLAPDSATLTVRQRLERIRPSDAPVSLWTISQIASAHRAALAIETNSLFEGGFRVLDFAPPEPALLHRADPEVLIVDTRHAPELKIGSDSPRAWIAAQRDDVLVFERAKGRVGAATFPDGGCRTELYSNRGLGYTEIETLSEEAVLAVGESIENTLTISLHRTPLDLEDAALAERLRALAGEPPFRNDSINP